MLHVLDKHRCLLEGMYIMSTCNPDWIPKTSEKAISYL